MLPAFIEPQLPKLATEAPASDRWLHEVKHDGYRMLARIDGSRPCLVSRHHLDWTTKFRAIADELAALPAGTVLDGEVCASPAGPVCSGATAG